MLNLNKKIVMIFFITILFLRKGFFKLILNNFNEVVFLRYNNSQKQ